MPETGLSGLEGGARFKPSFLPLSRKVANDRGERQNARRALTFGENQFYWRGNVWPACVRIAFRRGMSGSFPVPAGDQPCDF